MASYDDFVESVRVAQAQEKYLEAVMSWGNLIDLKQEAVNCDVQWVLSLIWFTIWVKRG